MAATILRRKCNYNKTDCAFSSPRYIQSRTEGKIGQQNNRFILDQSILEPDSHHTYLEFLEKNPLNLSFQKLNGKMELRTQKRLDLDKIEESYWCRWRPNKTGVFIDETKIEQKKNMPKQLRNTHGEGDINDNKVNSRKNQEGTKKMVPLEFKRSKPLSKIDELTEDDKDLDTTSSMSNLEEPKSFKFLRHTDSFILNSKRQSEEKPHYQQPRCIRLYKKNSSGTYIKGGSYPLRPCLKKESTFKGYARRTLSGTPRSSSVFKTTKNKLKPK